MAKQALEQNPAGKKRQRKTEADMVQEHYGGGEENQEDMATAKWRGRKPNLMEICSGHFTLKWE